jgi:hypothetical protein
MLQVAGRLPAVLGQSAVAVPDREIWIPVTDAEHSLGGLAGGPQVPISARPKDVFIVERLKLIPVASAAPPVTLIGVGVLPDGLMVTVSEADCEVPAWVATMVTGLLPPGMAVGGV